MIKIICLGALKENFLKEACIEYKKRISKYTKIEIIELKDEKDMNPQIALQKEKESILKQIKEKDNVIMLDLNGKQFTSEQFSEFLEKEQMINGNLTFIIGSSHGFDESLRKQITKKISFSSLTFPHQLFRIMLLEQIYRGYKIINNETYHK